MKIYMEVSLYDFDAWSGGADTLNRVIDAGKVEELEQMLDELYPEGLSDTELNDILWFEEDWVYETLGIRTESEIREEIDTLNDELAEIMESFNEESEGMTREEKTLLWNHNPNYGMDFETIEVRIKTLMKELDNW